MRKIGLGLALCAALILCMSSPATAKLFVVEIDGETVVVDFYIPAEQTWQDTPEGAPGYWEGLEWRPDPDYGVKIWYPFLADTFDMTLAEQGAWIRDLEYAGIDKWRIGYYWDTIPLKASMFGGMVLGLEQPNMVFDFNSAAYFPPTACGDNIFPIPVDKICMYLGRTGNEDGLTNGAIVNPMIGFPGPIPQSYLDDGVLAKTGMMGVPNYYNLPRSLAQDHWVSTPDSSMNGYNDDLNGEWDDTTVGTMSPVDDVTGEKPIGAWTVAESVPELWPANHKFHTITISDVIHPAGTLIPVTVDSVFQDEKVDSKGSGNTAPDAEIFSTCDAAVVLVRAERDGAGNGRVYYINFSDNDGSYTLEVGVPKSQGKKKTLIGDGQLYDSTAE